MAPSKTTNFKTYEAQTRLLAAVIATAGPRLDFKELAKHAGNNCTPSSIDHRLRPIKQLAKLQREAVAKGEDPANLPLEKGAIQELFGESTPAGIEWQFRDIKKMGKAQKAAVAKGESPINVVNEVVGKSRGGSAASTPANRASKHATAPTPSSRASAVSSSLSASRNKRKQSAKKYDDYSNEASDNGADSDYSAKDGELEATPSRKRGRMMENSNNTTPKAAVPVVDDSQVFTVRPPADPAQPPAAANATPRAPRHDPNEVIDLSETSPESETTAPASRNSQDQAQAQTQAQARPVPKVEPTSSSMAFSFDEPFEDPFKDHNGYMYDQSIDFGRNASDDEC